MDRLQLILNELGVFEREQFEHEAADVSFIKGKKKVNGKVNGPGNGESMTEKQAEKARAKGRMSTSELRLSDAVSYIHLVSWWRLTAISYLTYLPLRSSLRNAKEDRRRALLFRPLQPLHSMH